MIYFIQDESANLIKIGFTDGDPDGRLKSMQTGCPGGLVLLYSYGGTMQTEKALHKKFERHRERGEWFRPAPEILKFIIDHIAIPEPIIPPSFVESYPNGACLDMNQIGDCFDLLCPVCKCSENDFGSHASGSGEFATIGAVIVSVNFWCVNGHHWSVVFQIDNDGASLLTTHENKSAAIARK